MAEKEFSGVLGNYTWQETEDGSKTLYSHFFSEACHSTSGAKEETLFNYWQGCQIAERANQYSPFTILEIGFGPGIGLETTVEEWQKLNSPSKLHFLSVELDKALVEAFLPEAKVDIRPWGEIHTIQKSEYTATVLVGDATKTLPPYLEEFPVKWHAIYQDAFSPKRNPALWTVEWFELLLAGADPKAVMSTYSASHSVLDAMESAGWKTEKVKGFGRKRASTRAYPSN